MDIKVDGSSTEFDRGIVAFSTLGEDAVSVAAIVSRTSDLR